jgi:type I restriction enzyme M protein
MRNELKEISSLSAQLNCKSGLMLYKLLCSKQADFISQNGGVQIDATSFNDADYEAECLDHLGFFISKDNLFSTWINKGADFHVSDVMDACNALNRLSTNEFKLGASFIIDNLHNALTTLGESTQIQTDCLTNILYSISEIEINSTDELNNELNLMVDDQNSQSARLSM